MAFEGFPMEAFDFFFSLQFTNTPDNLDENREKYKKYVKGPLEELYRALLPTAVFVSPDIDTRQRRCISPMYNDMRIMRDRPINGYAYVRFRETYSETDVLALYFDAWYERCSYGIRIYKPTRDGMERIRRHVLQNTDGYARELRRLGRLGVGFDGDRYSRDHYPQIKDSRVNDLLNHKNLYVCRIEAPSEKASRPEYAEEIAGTLLALKKMYAMLKQALYGM